MQFNAFFRLSTLRKQRKHSKKEEEEAVVVVERIEVETKANNKSQRNQHATMKKTEIEIITD